MRLDTPLLRVLGPGTAKPLEAKLGLRTVGDLLQHYPRRFMKRGELTPIRDLQVGDAVTINARVVKAMSKTTSTGKFLTTVTVTDGTAELSMVFFAAKKHIADHHKTRVAVGNEVLCSGTVSHFNGAKQLANPEMRPGLEPGELVPVYGAAEKLSSDKVAKAVQAVLVGAELDAEPLPADLRRDHDLIPLRDAMTVMHKPRSENDLTRARLRLKWDEALGLQVVLAQRRAEARARHGTRRSGRAGALADAFDARLPFTLTRGQAEIGALLEQELAEPFPMHRLLQGDVGSGKTLVALRAMLRVVDSGGQAVLLAPTEVLAQQHARSIRSLLGPLGCGGQLEAAPEATAVALLTGSQGAAARRAALEGIRSGTAGIVVGTHALLSEGVDFHDLGLVVVDEQHRFGVEQRDVLRAKGSAPHLLVMTATPIPRTVAMAVFGDLDVSTLKELPAGRSPLQTHVVAPGGKAYARVWERVREEVAAGRQVFVVCPRIGDGADEPPAPDLEDDDGGGEPSPGAAVVEVVAELTSGPLAGLRVEVLHGRMPSDARETVMDGFVAGTVDVLVATTVIEVGVDVPNATVMVILDADRFGISQLHQLRGRVGRGAHPGLALLVTRAGPMSRAGERLRAVSSTSDGFELSQIDLELRGHGDVLGKDQAGNRSTLILTLRDDGDLLAEARTRAQKLVAEDPDLSGHPDLAAMVGSRYRIDRAQFLTKG